MCRSFTKAKPSCTPHGIPEKKRAVPSFEWISKLMVAVAAVGIGVTGPGPGPPASYFFFFRCARTKADRDLSHGESAPLPFARGEEDLLEARNEAAAAAEKEAAAAAEEGSPLHNPLVPWGLG